MILNIVRAVFAIFAIFYLAVTGRDIYKAKGEGQLESDISMPKSFVIGIIADFFDTLGIGSFAITIALFKFMKLKIHDKQIPGTLNVGHSLPVLLEAAIFTTAVKVDPITLIVFLVAAAIGSYVGASIISKLDEKKIQLVVGIALLITAVLMFLGHPWVNLMPGGGTATGLTGIKLVIGFIGNFILGILMTAGIGLYAPCMALVYFLGMSATAAYPIMMGSCALLQPVASSKFVKEGAYSRKAVIGIAIGGLIGVVIAVKFFTGLPMDVLKAIVIVVILYTAIMMIRSSRKRA